MSQVKSCQQLVREFEATRASKIGGKKLSFIGVGGRDVYNTTPPLLRVASQIKPAIVGRVENRYPPLDSKIICFEESGVADTWQPIDAAPVFRGEDPHITLFPDEIVLDYIRVWSSPWDIRHYLCHFQQVFLRGKDIFSLKEFCVGPWHMKDIQLFPLASGNIGVFTRPNRGRIGGLARIGYYEIADLSQLSARGISRARLLSPLTPADEWSGVNAPFSRAHNDVGFMGHMACFDQCGGRSYFGMMVDHFDTRTFEFTPPRIVATRSIFPYGYAKRAELTNVIFLSGFISVYEEEQAQVYFGLGDSEEGVVTIDGLL